MSLHQTAAHIGGRAQRGGMALLALFMLPVLLGFSAFVVDMGRLYVTRAEVQNAMDACALAAAQGLTPALGGGTSSPYMAARAYGRAMVDSSRRSSVTNTRLAESVNRLHFQRDNLQPGNVQVQFARAALTDTWEANPATNDYAYVRCSYTDPDNPLFVMPMLRFLGISVADTADVAGLASASLMPSQGACIFPVVLKQSAMVGLPIGTIIKLSYADPRVAGFTNFDNGGAAEIKKLIAQPSRCGTSINEAIPISNPVQIDGAVTSAWNTNFGLSSNPAAEFGPAAANPDYTSYSYTDGVMPNPRPYAGNISDYENRARQHELMDYRSYGPINPYRVVSLEDNLKYSQARRYVTAAVIDGAGIAKDFACLFMLSASKNGPAPANSALTPDMNLYYHGPSKAPGSPCKTTSTPGGTNGAGPKVPTLVQ